MSWEEYYDDWEDYTGYDAYSPNQKGIIAYTKGIDPIKAKYGTYAEFVRIVRPLQANGTHNVKFRSFMEDNDEYSRGNVWHAYSEIWNVCRSKKKSMPDVVFYVVSHYRAPKTGKSTYVFEVPRKGHAEGISDYLKVMQR